MGVTNFDIIKANQYLGLPDSGSGEQLNTGAVFYVGNGTLAPGAISASNSNSGKSPLDPFSTLTYAISQCTASRGDTIYILPGHSETVTAAGGITVDKAGVEIIGVGNGQDAPEFTFSSSTAASLLVSALNVKISNIVGIAGIDGLTKPFDIQNSNCQLDIVWRDDSSTVEAARAILATGSTDSIFKLKYLGNISGNACVNAIRLVNCSNILIDISAYGVASTAWVEFLTTASSDVRVSGYVYNSGTTDGSKNIIDTVTGSRWFAEIYDGSAGAKQSGGSGAALAFDDVSTLAANLNVPSADATSNTLERDVIGNKTDAAVTTVATTKSLIGYSKGLVQTLLSGAAADGSGNGSVVDVVGNKTDASVYAPSTTKSLLGYSKGNADLQEKVVKKTAATLVDAQTLFTITGGPIKILGLVSICETANDATASTLQYNVTPTSGSAQTISGASASLANAAAGASVTLAGTALATAALYNANGPNLIANPGTILAPAGTITAVVGTGSTTGTWAHYLRYCPMATGVVVA